MKTSIRSTSREAQRGSLLIVAMLLCAVIGISLTSYIRLARTGLTVSNRAFYNNASMNLAETGLEEAMYSISQTIADPSYSWTTNGWTAVGSTDVRRKLTGFAFDQNATGFSRVYVYNYEGIVAPKLVVRSSVTLGGVATAPIEKWVEVTLAKTSKFANGLVAKQQIKFSGNTATVDSWNSDPDNNPATAAIKYSSAVDNDNGSVGSTQVTVNAVNVQNADIFGYVATGGTPATVGNNGLVGPFGTTAGTIAAGHSSTNFTASFDPVSAPTQTTSPVTTISYISIASINDDTTLPGGTDTPAADGKYYYSASQINITNKVLTITANKSVVIMLTNTTTGVDVGGGDGEISIGSGAKFEIYTPGDVKIAGKGVMNGGTTKETANQPINFQIWGTKTSGVQSIDITGQGVLSAVVYAPQGSVKISGNGDVSGSVVANDIDVAGNALFHYDESLANFGAGSPYRVVSWKELITATQRNAYASVLNF